MVREGWALPRLCLLDQVGEGPWASARLVWGERAVCHRVPLLGVGTEHCASAPYTTGRREGVGSTAHHHFLSLGWRREGPMGATTCQLGVVRERGAAIASPQRE